MRTLKRHGAPVRRSLHRAIARLAGDQQGVALTEFVVCLPVFLLIFVGVVNLNKLQAEGMAVKMRATNNLWTEAIPVQKSTFGPRMLPSVQGGLAAAHIGSHFRYPLADTVGIASAGGLAGFGHFGESYALVKPVDMMANIWFSPPSFNLWNLFELDPPNHDHQLTWKGSNVYNNQKYARDLVDDSTVKSLPPAPGLLGFANAALTVSGARPAIAAGVRYGLAVGEDQNTVSFAGQNYSLSAGYDVLVAPKPTSELMTTGVTRLGIQSYKQLNWVLGIERSNKL